MIFSEYKRFHDILKLLVKTINYEKKSDLGPILANFISELNISKVNSIFGETKRANKDFDLGLISKLLINGWYDECAYHDPSVEEPTTFLKTDSNESFNRLRFPSWRVAQAYYSIYHTTAAVVRLKEYTEDSSHNLILRSLVNHFGPELDNFFPYPICCYIKNDKFINHSGNNLNEEAIKKILLEIHENKKRKGKADSHSTNLLHIFQNFREWCNYNAGEVLILFRSKHLRDYLDINLRALIYFINGINEIYLIKFLGYEEVADIFEDFYKNTVVNLRIEPTTISKRFGIYDHNICNLDSNFVLPNKARNRYGKEGDLEILNELGKGYFSKGWLFHARNIFNRIILEDDSFEKAKINLDIIEKHIEDLGRIKSIIYKTEYFEDKSSSFEHILSRERLRKMKMERQEKAKLLNVRIATEFGKFFVQSQSDLSKEYEVNFAPKINCNCRDFQFRRKIVKECKHVKASRPIWSNMQLV